MLFIPKSHKFKKYQKGKTLNKITKNNLYLNYFNLIGLKVLETGRITSKQLSSAKQAINKRIKRTGKVIVSIFPQHPISKKPKEIRMGKGKGSINHWVCKVTAGTILFEIKSSLTASCLKALKSAQIRLPLKTKIIF